MEHVNKFKAALAALTGVLTALWGWLGWLAVGWIVCMAADYLTGSMAAKEGRWNSAQAREGIWHKCGMIAVVLVAVGVDLLPGRKSRGRRITMGKDPLKIARGELGNTESPAGSNRTRYGAWYGLDGQPWCMMFVQWCFDQAGRPLPHKTASCSDLLSWYRKYASERIAAAPQPRDIIIYNFGHSRRVRRRSGRSAPCSRAGGEADGQIKLTYIDETGAVFAYWKHPPLF